MFDSTSERRGFPGGLRTQLLLGLVVLMIGTMALVALVGVHLAKRQVEQSELQRTSENVRQLAELRRFGPPRKIIRSYKTVADVEFAHLAVGEKEADFGRLPGTGVSELLEDVPHEQGAAPTVRTRSLDGDPFAVAVLSGGGARPWNAVVIRPLGEAYDRIAESRKLLLAYLGIDALFILIVGYAFLTYVVVRPIRAIGVATERAARGDLASHIEILPANEFGNVGRSFNRMLDELSEKRQELKERLEELDRAYRQLEQTQESLIRSEKLASVGQLAAGVAHEIGNPLSAISGYLDFFEDMDLDPEERRDITERMHKQVRRIRSIIRDLLDYSRDDSDQPIAPTALEPCIQEAVDLLNPQPRARGIDVEVDLDDVVPKVRGNDDQIVQVLVNLLINAADAIKSEENRSEGTIEVGVTSHGDVVELTISDDGPGIPEDERARIFDPFFTTKDPGEGTGLGLAISLRIMNRFGGDISFDTDADEGTTFVLSFLRA